MVSSVFLDDFCFEQYMQYWHYIYNVFTIKPVQPDKSLSYDRASTAIMLQH